MTSKTVHTLTEDFRNLKKYMILIKLTLVLDWQTIKSARNLNRWKTHQPLLLQISKKTKKMKMMSMNEKKKMIKNKKTNSRLLYSRKRYNMQLKFQQAKKMKLHLTWRKV